MNDQNRILPFLRSLASYLATQAGLRYATTPRQVWAGVGDESASDDPYSVLAVYGGPPLTLAPLVMANVQIMSIARKRENYPLALDRTESLYRRLLRADGSPASGLVIAGINADGSADGLWRLNSVEALSRPGFMGVSEERARASCNVLIGFCRP